MIIVTPYDPRWPDAFAEAAVEVRAALGGNLLEIQHIGSTSIHGMWAKPVIDMLAVVGDLGAIDERGRAMTAIGYEVMREFGIAGRRYFRRDNAAGVRTHQIHAFVAGSPHVERHLAFRDFLRSHPDEAEQYAALKRRLATAHPHDMEAYMDGKDGLIKDLEEKAICWRRSGM